MSYYYYFSFGKCVFFNIKQYFIFERNFRDLRAEVKKLSSGIQPLDGPYKMYLLKMTLSKKKIILLTAFQKSRNSFILNYMLKNVHKIF